MKLWSSRRRACKQPPSDEACEAVHQAKRLRRDVNELDRAAQDLARRVQETKARNHFTQSVAALLRRA